jgi:hypothetical protein
MDHEIETELTEPMPSSTRLPTFTLHALQRVLAKLKT